MSRGSKYRVSMGLIKPSHNRANPAASPVSILYIGEIHTFEYIGPNTSIFSPLLSIIYVLYCIQHHILGRHLLCRTEICVEFILLYPLRHYILENMRKFSGYKDIGQVIDKLVREKRISQSMYIQELNHDNSNKHR